MNIDARTKRNPQYAKFSCRLAKIAQRSAQPLTFRHGCSVIFREITVTFFQISRGPSRNYLQKANEQTFPTIYCPYRNIINFSCTSRIYKIHCKRHSKQRGEKKPDTIPLPLGDVDPVGL